MEEKNKKKFNIKKFITNDKYLIFLSLVLAVLIWTVTSINVGVDQDRTLKIEVPVKLANQTIDTSGTQFYTEQETVEISVKIRGAKYVVGQVTDEDFKINFGSVTKFGNQPIPIIISMANDGMDFEIEDYYPKQIDGYFDINETKTVDVLVNYNDDFAPEGYSVGIPTITDEQVVISGPKTYIDNVQNALLNINVPATENIIDMYNEDCPIELIGINGGSEYITIKSKQSDVVIDKIGVTLPILKNCDLPVTVKFEGAPKNINQGDIKITISPENISAGVRQNTDINEACVGTINYDEIPAGGKTFTYDASSLSSTGIAVLDGTQTIEVKVEVSDAYVQKNVYVDASNINVIGVPEGKKAVIKSISSDTVSVITPSDNASSIKSASVVMECDVSKPSPNNTYIVKVSLNDDYSWAYSTYTAVIELT